jgi:hypothetical protein
MPIVRGIGDVDYLLFGESPLCGEGMLNYPIVRGSPVFGDGDPRSAGMLNTYCSGTGIPAQRGV